MATQSHCQLCERHMKECDTAQTTLSVLRKDVDRLRVREIELVELLGAFVRRESESLQRERELYRALEETKQDNLSLRASLNSEIGTSGEPRKISQDTAEIFPQTPALLLPSIRGNADLTFESPTVGEASGATALSAGNLERFCKTPNLKKAETPVLPAIPEVKSLSGIASKSFTGGDLQVPDGDVGEASTAPVEPRSPEQGDINQQKESQSHDTLRNFVDAIDHHLDHSVPSSSERSAGSGSHKKRRTRILLQASSDVDDAAPPTSKKQLFDASFDRLETSNAPPFQERSQQIGTPESPGSTPETPGRVGIVGMEFGGGITVTEVVPEELGVDANVTSKLRFRRLKKKGSVASQGPAGVAEQPLYVGLRRSERLKQPPSTSANEIEDEIESSVAFQGPAEVTEQPLNVRLRKSERLKQPSPTPANENEDEIESSDAEFIIESSTESSESSKADPEFDGPSKSNEENSNRIDLSDSDSESPPLARRLRSNRATSGTQTQRGESSKSSQRSRSFDRDSSAAVVNLLWPLPEDEEEDDSDNSLSDFIVDDSEESVSTSEEQTTGSDSSGRENDSRRSVREEIAWRRNNMIWDLQGDMLVAITTNSDVAMQAICALYRQQTEGERHVKGALHRNRRGFDKMNARRGSRYAEFLVDGDKSGLLKKSAKALQARYPKAVEECTLIASHHSKQLFEIYLNNEDPFWRNPSSIKLPKVVQFQALMKFQRIQHQ